LEERNEGGKSDLTVLDTGTDDCKGNKSKSNERSTNERKGAATSNDGQQYGISKAAGSTSSTSKNMKKLNQKFLLAAISSTNMSSLFIHPVVG
jgi:hypothetical protein